MGPVIFTTQALLNNHYSVTPLPEVSVKQRCGRREASESWHCLLAMSFCMQNTGP